MKPLVHRHAVNLTKPATQVPIEVSAQRAPPGRTVFPPPEPMPAPNFCARPGRAQALVQRSPEMGREFHQTDQRAGAAGAQGSRGVGTPATLTCSFNDKGFWFKSR